MIRLWVSEMAAETMLDVSERHSPEEAGGVLLGYWAEGEVLVEVATPPGPLAVHSEHAYEPDSAHDQALISQQYALSGRRTTYLGDWHSHPGQGAYLSWKDLRSLCRIARTERARAPSPVMVIVAQPGNSPWGIDAWILPTAPRLWSWLARPIRVEVVLFG